MPAAHSPNFRPLLRLDSVENISASQIAECSYGGIILDASTHARNPGAHELIAECTAQKLEVWFDVSRLHSDELPRWILKFNGVEPHFSQSKSTLLDPFDERSAHYISQVLGTFDASHITGIIYEPHWRDASTSLLPGFPWSPLMRGHFDESKLVALVANTGDDAARIRQQYWQSLNGLHARMVAQLRAACDSKNWKFIARKSTPECEALQLDDVLFSRFDTDWPPLLKGNLPAEILRACYQFLHAGTTRFQIAYSPIAFSRGAKLLNESIERGVKQIATTRNATRVGVLFPARSCQTHYHPAGHRFLRWVSDDLKRITRALDELHFDWIFISEAEWLESESALEMIVIPSVTALSSQAWQACERFVEAGNKVACLGLLPRWNENGRDRQWEERVGKAALLSIEDLYAAYAAAEDGEPLPPTIGFPVFREHLSGGRLCCYQPHLNDDAEDARLRVHQILHESLTPDFETQSRDVLYSYRSDESETNESETNDRNEFFIFNYSAQSQHVNVRLRPAIETLKSAVITSQDAATGERRVLAVWMPHPIEQGGGLSLALDFAPGEARWIGIKKTTTNSSSQSFHLESANFAVENFDGATARGYATHSGLQKFASRSDKRLQWHEGNFTVVPPPILLDDNWKEKNLNEQTCLPWREYSQPVNFPDEWRDCRIILELARIEETIVVMVNEQACGETFSAPMRFEIGGAALIGAENRITLRFENPEPSAETERVLIARLVAYPEVEIKIEPVKISEVR